MRYRSGVLRRVVVRAARHWAQRRVKRGKAAAGSSLEKKKATKLAKKSSKSSANKLAKKKSSKSSAKKKKSSKSSAKKKKSSKSSAKKNRRIARRHQRISLRAGKQRRATRLATRTDLLRMKRVVLSAPGWKQQGVFSILTTPHQRAILKKMEDRKRRARVDVLLAKVRSRRAAAKMVALKKQLRRHLRALEDPKLQSKLEQRAKKQLEDRVSKKPKKAELAGAKVVGGGGASAKAKAPQSKTPQPSKTPQSKAQAKAKAPSKTSSKIPASKTPAVAQNQSKAVATLVTRAEILARANITKNRMVLKYLLRTRSKLRKLNTQFNNITRESSSSRVRRHRSRPILGLRQLPPLATQQRLAAITSQKVVPKHRTLGPKQWRHGHAAVVIRALRRNACRNAIAEQQLFVRRSVFVNLREKERASERRARLLALSRWMYRYCSSFEEILLKKSVQECGSMMCSMLPP